MTTPDYCMHEDMLPEDITDAEFDAWYAKSWIPDGIGCRVGPVFVRKPTEFPFPEPKWVRHMRIATIDNIVPHESEYLAYVDALINCAAGLKHKCADSYEQGYMACQALRHVDAQRMREIERTIGAHVYIVTEYNRRLAVAEKVLDSIPFARGQYEALINSNTIEG